MPKVISPSFLVSVAPVSLSLSPRRDFQHVEHKQSLHFFSFQQDS